MADVVARFIGIFLILSTIVLASNWLPASQEYSQAPEHQVNLNRHCKGKMRIAKKSFELLREQGWTIEQAIDDLHMSRVLAEKKNGTKIPQYMFLEYERMARTIDRHPEIPKEELMKQFKYECAALGF